MMWRRGCASPPSCGSNVPGWRRFPAPWAPRGRNCDPTCGASCRGYVIFFRYRDDAVEVVNVLHGHRDVIGYFGQDPG
ncbi:type II toxin-antitoxin system RelE/ParE family toxin [Pseudoroseomonas wenyumeiae]